MRNLLIRHAEGIAVFVVSISFVLVLCLPLTPYELPNINATLLGSAYGAVFAVLGALWIWRIKQRSSARETTIAICALFPKLREALFELLPDYSSKFDGTKMSESLSLALYRAELAQSQLQRFQAMTPMLGFSGACLLFDIEDDLREFLSACHGPQTMESVVKYASGMLEAQKFAKTLIDRLQEFDTFAMKL